MTAIEPKSDAEFARWIKAHPHGFVLHTRATPDPRYTVLHRAYCHLISLTKRGVMAGAATERHSRKVCAGNCARNASVTAKNSLDQSRPLRLQRRTPSPLCYDPVAIVLHFVEPLRPARSLVRQGGLARLDETRGATPLAG